MKVVKSFNLGKVQAITTDVKILDFINENSRLKIDGKIYTNFSVPIITNQAIKDSEGHGYDLSVHTSDNLDGKEIEIINDILE